MQFLMIICKILELFFLFAIFTGVYQIGKNQMLLMRYLVKRKYFISRENENNNN